jgi:putative DeoR family transcriptional regulator (stage III sporulation protein D)
MGSILHDGIKKRTIEEAHYIIENRATIRETAQAFSVSKSTVHRDIKKFLESLDQKLYEKVDKVINFNLSERHLRGGEANRLKAKERQSSKLNEIKESC